MAKKAKKATKKAAKKATKKVAKQSKYEVQIDLGNGGTLGVVSLKDVGAILKEQLVTNKGRSVHLNVSAIFENGERRDGVK